MQRFDMAATLHFNVRPTATQTSPVLPKAGLFLAFRPIGIDTPGGWLSDTDNLAPFWADSLVVLRALPS
ncbi:hypothetical protein EHI48_28560 [Rhizobium sp. WSM1325]|nr:hypothetical protein EHI48_28560 [Rhizobium leguminosarum]